MSLREKSAVAVWVWMRRREAGRRRVVVGFMVVVVVVVVVVLREVDGGRLGCRGKE